MFGVSLVFDVGLPVAQVTTPFGLSRPAFVIGLAALLTATLLVAAAAFREGVPASIERTAAALLREAFPSSPLLRRAVAIGLIGTLVVSSVFGAVAFLPETDAGRSGGGASFRSDILAVRETLDVRPVGRPRPDADGDRLKDGWERDGRTPNGVPLPGADPEHKDLYVQLNYGRGVAPLTDDERRDLQRIWATMPVSNPDGTDGITLHLIDAPPRGGSLDADVSVYEDPRAELEHRYRTDLSDAKCVYYQGLLGNVTSPRYDGWALTPGYSFIADGRRTETLGPVTIRVAITTHELLHNTVGLVNGTDHTASGWLRATYDGTNGNLSADAADELSERGFEVSALYERRFCR